MSGYVVNFTVYTMAMIGLICFAVFVYKKIMDGSFGKKHTRCIEIEDTLNLNPRKTLHIIRAGEEKFLIASDMDRTTLISKLKENRQELPLYTYQDSKQTFRNTMDYVQSQTERTPDTAPKRVHLEPITRKNEHSIGISNLRNSMDTRTERQVQRQVPVQKKVQQPIPVRQSRVRQSQQKPAAAKVLQQQVKTAGATMKDMAKKINEL